MTRCEKCRTETDDLYLISGVCLVCLVMNPTAVPLIRFGKGAA